MSIYDWSATLKTHRQCVGDASRTNSYAAAIAEIVKEGDVVVDVGTGTGILAIMACRAGAKTVYAVEPDQIIESARQVCADNGLAEQITFLTGLSHDVTLPERADVLIAGHVHNFGLEMGLLGSTIDAQERFLKPGASIIPQSVELHVVPVEVPDVYAEVIEFWNSNPADIEFSSVRELAVENCYMAELQPATFLSEPSSLIKLRLDELKGTFVSGRTTFTVSRKGILHGIGGWCSAELSPKVLLSNDPAAPSAHWSQIYFPISEPVAVAAGDCLTCSIDTNDGHIWRWRVEIRKQTKAGGTNESPHRRFDHSTFHPEFVAKDMLKRSSSVATLSLSPKGRALLQALKLASGQKTRLEIEDEIEKNFGDCFPSRACLATFISQELDKWVL